MPFAISFFTFPFIRVIVFSSLSFQLSHFYEAFMIPIDHIKRVISGIFFLFLATLTACGTTPPSGNTENGQKWYKMNNCNACHGEKGIGGRGPNIAGLDMGFGSFVKKLRKKDAPIMPPFPESKISEQDAADIYTYLRSSK